MSTCSARCSSLIYGEENGSMIPNKVGYLICFSLTVILTVMIYIKEPENILRLGLSLLFGALYLGLFIYEVFKDRKKNKKQ